MAELSWTAYIYSNPLKFPGIFYFAPLQNGMLSNGSEVPSKLTITRLVNICFPFSVRNEV